MIFKILGKTIVDTILHSAKQPLTKTPKEYNISYRDIEFSTNDGVKLSGWLLNEGEKNIIIMTHFGYRANRFGYQTKYQGIVKPYNKEIEFILVAKQLVQAGYTVLMYDLRNHGESGKSAKRVGTGGVDESQDVLAAIEFIAKNESTTGKNIALLSYCMGANATFWAMGHNPTFFVESRVKALIAMQPITSGEFLRAYGINKRILKHAEEYYKKRTGYSLDHPILPSVEKVPVPTLLCQGLKDPWTNYDFVRALYETLPVEKNIYWIEGIEHRFDGYNWFGDHPEKMVQFFQKYLT